MPPQIVTVADHQYRIATWKRRLAARSIDLVLAGVAITSFGSAFWPITMPIVALYLAIGNGILGGQSLGKSLLGLKVIDSMRGGPCNMLQDLLRVRYYWGDFDSSNESLERPDCYVVRTGPVSPAESEADREAHREKPAHLDLDGLKDLLEHRHKDGEDRDPDTP